MNTEQMQVNIFKALGHPIRLKIVKKLLPCAKCVCELNDDIEFSQSNLSQHLKILRDAGVLESHRDGLKIIYTVCHKDIEKLITTTEKIINNIVNELVS